ncbi:hypothetical protein HDU76_009984, partial [Blyttiomyces sp. JEL0837]
MEGLELSIPSVETSSSSKSYKKPTIKLPEITAELCTNVLRFIAFQVDREMKFHSTTEGARSEIERIWDKFSDTVLVDGVPSILATGSYSQLGQLFSIMGPEIHKDFKKHTSTHIATRIRKLVAVKVLHTCHENKIPYVESKVWYLSAYIKACFEWDEKTEDAEIPPWRPIKSIRMDVISKVFQNRGHCELISKAITNLINELQTMFALVDEATKGRAKFGLLPICKKAITLRTDELNILKVEIEKKPFVNTLERVPTKYLKEQISRTLKKVYLDDLEVNSNHTTIETNANASSGTTPHKYTTKNTPPNHKRFQISYSDMKIIVNECYRVIGCIVEGQGVSSSKLNLPRLTSNMVKELQVFVNNTAKMLLEDSFNPEVYHIPRGCTKYYNPMPLSGFTPGYVSIDT